MFVVEGLIWVGLLVLSAQEGGVPTHSVNRMGSLLGLIFWGGYVCVNGLFNSRSTRCTRKISVSTMALEATAIGPAQFFECNDKVRLKYTDVGPRTAPALVLLHGWSANGNWFARK